MKLKVIDSMQMQGRPRIRQICGNLVGYTDLGEVNNHLLAFQRMVKVMYQNQLNRQSPYWHSW